MLPDIFSPEALAKHEDCSLRTIYRMMSEPDGLPFIDIPGGRRIRRESWDAYLKRRERQSCPSRTKRKAA
jgi:hypothetical protein